MPKYFSCQDLNTVYVYISVNHVYVEVCVHMSMPCMQVLAAVRSCPVSSISLTIFFEIVSLNEHGAHKFGKFSQVPRKLRRYQPAFWYSTVHGSENLNLNPYAFVAAVYGMDHLPVSKALFIKILCSLTPADCIEGYILSISKATHQEMIHSVKSLLCKHQRLEFRFLESTQKEDGMSA